MTDNELRELCERVARYWLGWKFLDWGRLIKGNSIWAWCYAMDNGEWTAVCQPDRDTIMDKREDVMRLNSDWGRGLVLRAVEKKPNCGWEASGWNHDIFKYKIICEDKKVEEAHCHEPTAVLLAADKAREVIEG